MYLYHYCSIQFAVGEIENTSFRIANRTELNDRKRLIEGEFSQEEKRDTINAKATGL